MDTSSANRPFTAGSRNSDSLLTPCPDPPCTLRSMISSAEIATDSFHSRHAAPGREGRAAAAYLWLGLPLMFVVRLTLPLAGYAGVCLIGLAHLGLLSAVVKRLQRRSVTRDAGLQVASMLLVLGPAVFFLGAVTGSPNPAHSLDYAWNTIGVTTGSLFTTAGFVALATSLWLRGEQLSAALAGLGVVLATKFWLPTLGLRVAVLAMGSGQAWANLERVYAHVRSTNVPMTELADSWRGFLLLWVYALSTLSKVLNLLACAIFAVALRRRGTIGAATARVGGVLSVALAALIVFGRPFLPFPAVRIAWAVATIPFIVYVLPYVLGSAIARRGVHAPEENLSPNTAI
jgi:hypothetical protein